MTVNYRVSRDFISYSDSDLDEFANNVITNLTGNAAFLTPPVITTVLTTLDEAFRAAIAAATGDPQDTIAKNNARTALENALRKDASYVESIASQNLAILLSSGYYASSTNRVQTQLDAPVIMDIESPMTTQLLLRLTPVTNAKSYQVQISANGGGAWTEAGIYTQSRRIVLTGLTSGATYNARTRAIGGSTGYSDWSIPAARVVT
ncbi:MAG: hypothetical protein ACREFR_06590 [Limisphaerales bacterium]